MTAWQHGVPPGTPQHTRWTPAQAPVAPLVLVGLSLWRLLIAASGLTGFLLAMNQFGGWDNAFPGLSQQASLLVAVVYFGLACYPLCTGLRRHEPNSPWLRGAMTVLLLLVGGAFLTLMGGGLDEGWSLFEHLLTPLLVLIDWAAVGRNQVNCKWWHPPTWLVFPLLYLIYFNVADVDLYDFPLKFGDDDFIGYFFGFLFGVIAAGYLLFGIAMLRTMLAAPMPGAHIPGAHIPGPQIQVWQQHPYQYPPQPAQQYPGQSYPAPQQPMPQQPMPQQPMAQPVQQHPQRPVYPPPQPGSDQPGARPNGQWPPSPGW